MARSLWAKKSRSGDLLWLPLPTHLADAVEIARLLWRIWLPEGVKLQIASGIHLGDVEEAERLFIFLTAAHDLGKATPAFATQQSGNRELDMRIHEQIMDTGLPIKPEENYMFRNKTPHALASQVILTEMGCPESVAVVLGAHHGKPPELQMLQNNLSVFKANYGHDFQTGRSEWKIVQKELIQFALHQAGYENLGNLPEINITAQVLLSGLLIVADWIASDSRLFPYIHLDDRTDLDSRQRAKQAWSELDFVPFWMTTNEWMQEDLYQLRFGFGAVNPIQKFTRDALEHVRSPGIMVIEAPMGSGKTEAALVAAEIMADLTKRRGVFFALPTQATSDGIFPRLVQWLTRLGIEQASTRLMHGKAQFNDTFRNLAFGKGINVDEETEVFVHEWFNGRKRSILDDFVIGTIDQLLMAALKQKHVMLRHLGLANKVVIIDECHAFDAYMNCYLERALNWLGSYGVPVIVLSATLPFEKRKMVVEAYCNKRFGPSGSRKWFDPLGKNRLQSNQDRHNNHEWIKNRAYPLITYTDGTEVRQVIVPSHERKKHIEIDWLDERNIEDKLAELLQNGGCAGVIVNSVSKAQKLARQLKDKFGRETVQLFHSRFITKDRMSKEKALLLELGKPGNGGTRPDFRIVVGTQVLEQSLDIDFDVLITEICPMDLLLQRLGRLHRHERDRPLLLNSPRCYVTGIQGNGFDKASEAIYGKYLLMRTRVRLPNAVIVPDDIPHLVQDVYDDSIHLIPEDEAYLEAKRVHELMLGDKRAKANSYRVNEPRVMDTMIGWLDIDISDKKGEAAVRDANDSFEVLLIQRDASGTFRFLPWIESGRNLDRFHEPPEKLARELAKCSVQLPVAVTGRHDNLESVIRQLEEENRQWLADWQQSPWLRGELFLILDESLSVKLGKYRLTYHKDFGLEYFVEEG